MDTDGNGELDLDEVSPTPYEALITIYIDLDEVSPTPLYGDRHEAKLDSLSTFPP